MTRIDPLHFGQGIGFIDFANQPRPGGSPARRTRSPVRLVPQASAEGSWTGCLSDADVAKLDPSKMKYLPGPAGSLTIHDCRALHYSAKNDSDLGRPPLLNAMSSADAFPCTVKPIKPKRDQYLLRGKRAQFAHHDPRPCLMPPDWSKGYTSILRACSGKSRPKSRGDRLVA